MDDDAAVFLLRTGEEARHIDERHDRNVEGVAETDETGTLARGVDVKHTGQVFRLVGHDTDGRAAEAGKAHDEVLRIVLVDFEELAVVHDGADDFVHVVRGVRAVGDDLVEGVLFTVDRVFGRDIRGLFHVVLREIAHQLTDGGDGVFLGSGLELGHAALGSVDGSTAEFLLRHVLAEHLLDDGRTGQEHIRGTFRHDDEVGQSGGVNRTAGARAEDCGDLRNHARGEDVALKDLGVAGQGVHTFLDTGAARVVEADARGTVLHGHVHHLADLLGQGLGQGAADHGEVLCEDIDQTAGDRAVTGHHTVAQVGFLLHAEVVAAVGHEHVEFFEATLVEEHVDALASRVFPFGVLAVDTFLAAAHASFLPEFDKLLYFFKLLAHIGLV